MTLDAEARAFAKANPKHSGGTWYLFCGTLMYRMCDAYGVTPIPIPTTAKLAGDAAGKLNSDATLAPVGAFHYWTCTGGHVGLDTTGGGRDVFMASSYLRESLGDCIGFQSVIGYTRGGIYPYLGWSMNYGKNGHVVVPVTTADVTKVLDEEGIIDAATPGDTPVTYQTLRWALYNLEHRKV
jgi:hypothetical protein